MNISTKTEIEGLEKTNCTKEHLEHCLNDYTKTSGTSYTYFGKRRSKGFLNVLLKTGSFRIYFEELNGWATKIKVL